MKLEDQAIDIEFFASLCEEVGCRTLTVPALEAAELFCVADVRAWVVKRFGEAKCAELMAERTRVAVNDEFVELNTRVRGGDRVAFLPRVTGG